MLEIFERAKSETSIFIIIEVQSNLSITVMKKYINLFSFKTIAHVISVKNDMSYASVLTDDEYKDVVKIEKDRWKYLFSDLRINQVDNWRLNIKSLVHHERIEESVSSHSISVRIAQNLVSRDLNRLIKLRLTETRVKISAKASDDERRSWSFNNRVCSSVWTYASLSKHHAQFLNSFAMSSARKYDEEIYVLPVMQIQRISVEVSRLLKRMSNRINKSLVQHDDLWVWKIRKKVTCITCLSQAQRQEFSRLS